MTVFFRYTILCVLTLVTRKLQVIYGHSVYQTIALLLEMSIFCVRAVCAIPVVSYGSKHALQSLSNKPFVRTYMYNLNTSGHRTIAIVSDKALWYIGISKYRDILAVTIL